jgi:hypothetical protein
MTPWQCPQCGKRRSVRVFPIHCSCGFTQYHNPPGLGDRVAATLARLGITEGRYRRAKQLMGLAGDCGCKSRQRRLNELTAHRHHPKEAHQDE